MKNAGAKEIQDVDLPDFCRAMVDGSPMPMAFVNGDSFAIRYVNPAFRLLAGESRRHKLIGDSFSHAMPGSRKCLSTLDRVHHTGRAETYVGEEYFPEHPLYFSYVIWPVLAEGGRRLGLMIQVTETTQFHNRTIEMNEALILGSVRQHQLTESAETLNVQLNAEILHRKQVEEEMEIQALEITVSEQRYRGLIEAIPQIVWTATPDGTLDFANAKWFENFHIDLDTFNRVGWSALLHPDDKSRTLDAWTGHLCSGSAFEIEHRLRGIATRAFRWYLSRAVPIRGSEGQVAKWFGTSTDLEDQKLAELAVFNKQKLESLGLLAGGIAHDFNNLLCGILGGASLVADSLAPDHPLQPILGDMGRSSERAAHLTRQMLAYSGKGRFLVERVDMGELVRSTCDLIKGSIPNHVRLTFGFHEDLPPVEADSGQMQQVVMNLILNAAEAIGDPNIGIVNVKTDFKEIAQAEIETIPLVTGNLIPGSYVVVEVQDDGSGMTEATQAKIFDPFYTTKFTGRGLGLSAVEGILRTQKGALEISSQVGTGSTFRVYLPAAKRNPHLKTSLRAVQGRGSGTILVIDDEEVVRRIMQISLENGGFSVLAADGGEDAVRLLRSGDTGAISLIVLDLSMPGMGGKQVLQEIRGLGIKAPVLICSGYSEEEVLREFAGLDIAGFIQKPFTPVQMANRVASILQPASPGATGPGTGATLPYG